MAQKRIHALDPYAQLNPGDSGYIAPTAIRLAVDSTSFPGEPKYITYSSLLSDGHFEVGRLTGLASASVSILFGTSFSAVPSGLANLKVYKFAEITSGKYEAQDVLYYFENSSPVTTDGFDLIIDSSESLTGVIVEYLFTE